MDPPSEADIEKIVVQGFESLRKHKIIGSRGGVGGDEEDGGDIEGIDGEAFVAYCLNTPEIISWIEYYDDLDEIGVEKNNQNNSSNSNGNNSNDSKELMPLHMLRTIHQETIISSTFGGLKRLEYERKGLAKDILRKKNWQNVIPLLSPARQSVNLDVLPIQRFSMDWVYGYNAHSSKQNLFYTCTGSMIYGAGGVCIVQDILQKTQSYFTQHKDLITCINIFHSNDSKTIVATGECGMRPVVHIWDSDTKKILSSIQGYHRKGILFIDFSPNKLNVIIMGMDKYHCITLDNWLTKERLWSTRSTPDIIYDMKFLTPTLIGVVGKNHFQFFAELKNNKNRYNHYKGLFGGTVQPECLYCVAAIGKYFVCFKYFLFVIIYTYVYMYVFEYTHVHVLIFSFYFLFILYQY